MAGEISALRRAPSARKAATADAPVSSTGTPSERFSSYLHYLLPIRTQNEAGGSEGKNDCLHRQRGERRDGIVWIGGSANVRVSTSSTRPTCDRNPCPRIWTYQSLP